jgi:hypothetical protein
LVTGLIGRIATALSTAHIAATILAHALRQQFQRARTFAANLPQTGSRAGLIIGTIVDALHHPSTTQILLAATAALQTTSDRFFGAISDDAIDITAFVGLCATIDSACDSLVLH